MTAMMAADYEWWWRQINQQQNTYDANWATMTVTEYDRQWQQKSEWQWRQREIICDLNVSDNDEANLGNDENDSDNDKNKILSA